MQFLVPLLIFLAIILKLSVYILAEYERAVIFRLGRVRPTKGPGLILAIPFIDRVVRVDQRTVTMDIPTQDVITRDNISIQVNAVLYFRVMDPSKAIVQVENYLYATSQLAQTTLRSICGEASLDDLLQKREEINLKIQDIIDHQTDPWGIKVSLVEIKHIDLPQEMQRAMAKQAEAERDRRAKIIQAEGEFQAAEKLKDAAEVLSQEPITIQLRFLDTLRSISRENNSTAVFPIPLDLMHAFEKFIVSQAKKVGERYPAD